MIEKDGFKLISKYRTQLMGVAALFILFFHEGIKLWENVPVIGAVEGFVKRAGFFGVDIFFFLSGMGLVYAIAKSSIPMFYYKRIRRIIIPFLVMAIVRTVFDQWPIVDFWKNIFGINFYAKSIYSFLWFVPAILTLYLLFPLYYQFFSKAKNKALFTGGVIVVWLIVSMVLNGTLRNDLYGFTNRIPIFVIGVLIGYFQKNRTFDFTKGTWFVLLLVLVLGIYLSIQTNEHSMFILVPVSNCCVPNMLMAFSFSCLFAKLLDILDRKVSAVGKATGKIFGFFGMISLEFYCVQEFLGGKIISGLTGKIDNAFINIIVFAAVTVSALLLYLLSTYFFKGIEFAVSKITKKPIDFNNKKTTENPEKNTKSKNTKKKNKKRK